MEKSSCSRLFFLIIPLLIFMGPGIPMQSMAQESGDPGDRTVPVSVEVQLYPSGQIVGAGITLFRINSVHSLTVRGAYNFVDRGSAGVQDLEEGGGFGAGVEYSYRSGSFLKGTIWALRSDFWWLTIDWEDRIPLPGEPRFGSTDITVWQPTFQVSYDLLDDDPSWDLTPSVAIGYEKNIRTDGKEVGDGMILLGGLRLTRYL